MLDKRKEAILTAVIDDYIGTAEPVSSKSIVERHQLRVSPATIRNEMARLEELGYLRQPHTSAGRVPTDKGYRHYVDQRVRLFSPSSRQEHTVFERLHSIKEKELEDLFHQISLLLANVTGSVSLLLSLSSGFSLQRVALKRRIYFWGLSHALHEPEFGNVHRVEFLLDLLECEDKMAGLLMQGLGGEGPKVLIGGENDLVELRDFSLVLASYGLGERPLGTLGIIGPTRMDYVKTVPTVDVTARALSEMLETCYG